MRFVEDSLTLCPKTLFVIERIGSAVAVYLRYESTMAKARSNSGSRLPQMLSGSSSSATYSPLSELMRAIILRVVDDCNGNEEVKADAVEYLYGEDDEYIFSFPSICHHFGVDPEKTRDHILYPRHRIATRRRAS